jgi:serine/threonine protein kinase
MGLNLEWQSGDLLPDKLFTIKEKLGQGSFGSVHKAVHLDGFRLAIKEIKDVTNNDEIQNELDILKMCCHPNIVSYFGFLKTKSGSLWILMDYMALGSVWDMIDYRQSPLTEPELANVCAYTLQGLNYIQPRGPPPEH